MCSNAWTAFVAWKMRLSRCLNALAKTYMAKQPQGRFVLKRSSSFCEHVSHNYMQKKTWIERYTSPNDARHVPHDLVCARMERQCFFHRTACFGILYLHHTVCRNILRVETYVHAYMNEEKELVMHNQGTKICLPWKKKRMQRTCTVCILRIQRLEA